MLDGELGNYVIASGGVRFKTNHLAEHLFDRTKKLVEEQMSSDPADVAEVAECLREIDELLAKYHALSESPIENDTIQGIVAALTIGFHHRGGPGVLRRWKKEVDTENGDRMHTARRIDNIRDIICKHAKAHLADHPEDSGIAERVAKAIADDVAREVQALAKLPKEWRVALPSVGKFSLTGKDLTRYVGRIRRELPRFKWWRNGITP